ncbi:hypothetical protein LAZ67_5001139 [Cordylochernes scorpioides]|uniref:ubiquitinyl hydrolase 1 n=1 Tax=Cordylochernes scorpioides TaxID=51811 RepID=A0ABY6KFF0_9ARAC|nr:hypothetical protein LAZ67_5001139 [Cordylochernes scorpioides]
MYCFEELFKDESPQDYVCYNCQSKVSLNSSFGIKKWPIILIIQLLRFSAFDMPKMNKMVSCPITLELEKFIPKTNYNLFGVISHYGTLKYGHFKATVNWYKFDDNSVKKIAPNNIITSNAFVFFTKFRVKKNHSSSFSIWPTHQCL